MAQHQERRFDPAFLDDLRDRTPLEALVGRTVDLKRSGGSQTGCCPFHGERTPSFTVYKDHFHCFGCGAHGDAIEFVQQRDRVSFPDAVARLAAEAGMELPGAKPLPVTAEERARQEAAAAERSRQLEAKRVAAERADAEREAAIARKAEAVWAKSKPAPADHPYLVRKGVEPYDLRVDAKGNLLVPLRDDDGRLWNLQTISAAGDKRTLWRRTPHGPEGGRTKGLSYTIGSLDGAPAVAVATGFATAASIRADTDLPTRMAFSDSNLLPVVRGLRDRHPKVLVLLGADNDHHALRKSPPRENQGLAKAQEVAAAVPGVRVVTPAFGPADPGTDWNDYRAQHGQTAVKPHFEAALVNHNMEQQTVPQDVQPPAFIPPDTPLADARPPPFIPPTTSLTAGAKPLETASAAAPQAVMPAATVPDLVAQIVVASAGNPRVAALAGKLALDLREKPGISDSAYYQHRLARALHTLDEVGIAVAVDDGFRAQLSAARPGSRLGASAEVLATRTTANGLGATPPDPSMPEAGDAKVRTPVVQQAAPGQGQGPVRQAGPIAAAVGGAMSSLFAAMRPPEPETPPQWQQPAHPLGSRLRDFEERRAATVTSNLSHAAEQAGERAQRALEALSQGPGGAVLAKIKEAAAGDPEGMRGVVAGMQPGGKYVDLRSAFNDALVRERAFSAAYDRAVGGITEYGASRVKLNDGLAGRSMDVSVLDKQFGEMDREMAGAAEGLPGRKAGQSVYDEIAEKAAKLAKFFADVIERVRTAIKPGEAPGQAPAPQTAPAMAPAMAP